MKYLVIGIGNLGRAIAKDWRLSVPLNGSRRTCRVRR